MKLTIFTAPKLALAVPFVLALSACGDAEDPLGNIETGAEMETAAPVPAEQQVRFDNFQKAEQEAAEAAGDAEAASEEATDAEATEEM